MKKVLLICLLLIGINYIFALNFNKYKYDCLVEFQTGKEINQLGIDYPSPSNEGPSAIAFDQKGNLYISDILKNRVVKFSSTFIYIEEYEACYAALSKQIFVSQNGEILSYNGRSFSCDTASGEKKFQIAFVKGKYRNLYKPNQYFYNGNNIVYISLKDNNIISIQNPTNNWQENNKKIIQKEETLAKLNKLNQNKNLNNTGKLYIDEKKRLFKGNELLTRDFRIFLNYWDEQHKSKNIQSEKQIDEKYYTRDSDVRYIGKDKDNNTYWQEIDTIFIFNAQGILLDGFIPVNPIIKTLPAIHPTGDIYYLDYDAEGVYLYKITRRW